MGLNKDGLKRFSVVAASHVDDDKVPGLVALVAQGDDVHVETLGTLTVGGRPVERTSLFRIAWKAARPVRGSPRRWLWSARACSSWTVSRRLLPELANRRVLRRLDGPLDDTLPAVASVTVRGLLTFTVRIRDGPGDVHGTRAVAGRRGGGGGRTGHHRAAAARRFRRPWYLDRQVRRAALAGTARPAAALQHRRARAERALRPNRRGVVRRGLRTRSSSRSACATPASTPRTSIGWRRRTCELRTGWPGPARRAVSRPSAFHDGAAGLVSTADDLLVFARMLLRGGDRGWPRTRT